MLHLASRSLRVSALRRAAPAARALCTATEAGEVPLIDTIHANIAEMKATLEKKSVTQGYTLDEFKAALSSRSVDASKMGENFGNHAESKAAASMILMNLNKLRAEPQVVEEIDWASWEDKLGDAKVVGEVKGWFEAEVAKAEAENEAAADPFQTQKDDLKDAFHRPGDGIYALAAEHEKESRASMVASLAAMEKLAIECEGLKEMTVAEVLDREPELRAQIEEEIRNHVWAP